MEEPKAVISWDEYRELRCKNESLNNRVADLEKQLKDSQDARARQANQLTAQEEVLKQRNAKIAELKSNLDVTIQDKNKFYFQWKDLELASKCKVETDLQPAEYWQKKYEEAIGDHARLLDEYLDLKAEIGRLRSNRNDIKGIIRISEDGDK